MRVCPPGDPVVTLEDESSDILDNAIGAVPDADVWLDSSNRSLGGQRPRDLIGAAAVEDGWVWQAEEIRRGNQWERDYGFVGRHVIARVPAGSIDLAGGPPLAPGAR